MRRTIEKKIKEDLAKKGIEISQNKIKKILRKCDICQRKDKKYLKSGAFVSTSFPGERLGFDLMELKRGDLVILGIDYFTRKVFGKTLSTKESRKIVDFIREVHKSFPIKTIVCDNGKEFNNDLLKGFSEENNIEISHSIPYYHESNGRIERANKTIREALKRTPGPTRKILSEVVAKYNDTIHRGIGMTPNDACLGENKAKV